MKRNVYQVFPDGQGWKVQHAGEAVSTHETKEPAVEAGRELARGHEPSQLVVHRADGTAEYEWTYGES